MPAVAGAPFHNLPCFDVDDVVGAEVEDVLLVDVVLVVRVVGEDPDLLILGDIVDVDLLAGERVGGVQERHPSAGGIHLRQRAEGGDMGTGDGAAVGADEVVLQAVARLDQLRGGGGMVYDAAAGFMGARSGLHHSTVAVPAAVHIPVAIPVPVAVAGSIARAAGSIARAVASVARPVAARVRVRLTRPWLIAWLARAAWPARAWIEARFTWSCDLGGGCARQGNRQQQGQQVAQVFCLSGTNHSAVILLST